MSAAQRRVGVTGPGERVAPLGHEGGWAGAGYGLTEELKVLVQSRWYRRGRGKAGPGGRRTKWRRLMAACPPLPPPPLPARHRRRRRCRCCHHRSRAGKRRKHSAHPDSPGRVCGGPGPGPGAPRGGMAVGRGRMAADGAGFSCAGVPRSSAAGLRLTAHPGNHHPREYPPPPASLRV